MATESCSCSSDGTMAMHTWKALIRLSGLFKEEGEGRDGTGKECGMGVGGRGGIIKIHCMKFSKKIF